MYLKCNLIQVTMVWIISLCTSVKANFSPGRSWSCKKCVLFHTVGSEGRKGIVTKSELTDLFVHTHHPYSSYCSAIENFKMKMFNQRKCCRTFLLSFILSTCVV